MIVTQTVYVRFACDHEYTLIPGDEMPHACPQCYLKRPQPLLYTCTFEGCRYPYHNTLADLQRHQSEYGHEGMMNFTPRA